MYAPDTSRGRCGESTKEMVFTFYTCSTTGTSMLLSIIARLGVVIAYPSHYVEGEGEGEDVFLTQSE
jgi:hypothetical protein